MPTKLLDRFQALFEGQVYDHRNSTLGDRVAEYLYEDLFDLAQSRKLLEGVAERRMVLNSKNTTHGVQHRRGDGTFGIVIPGEEAVEDPGYQVARGPIATMLIGAEVKVVCKAMVRQIDRVKTALVGSVREFRKSNRHVLTVGIVAVNHASIYRSFEGTREYVTTGGGRHKHPFQEADKVIAHLAGIRSRLDELLILRFDATNMEPFPFSWVDPQEATRDYASVLVRISSQFDQRF
jgi:hypothetical protein